MQANLQAEVFTTEQVAAALGMRSAAQLSNWLRRGFVLVDPDHETPGTGKMRLFTAARAVQIAIAARLIQSGIPVTDASLMAAEFSDFGISVGWSGQADPEHERGAGGLFSRGTTVMRVVFGGGDEKPSHEILRFEKISRSPSYSGPAPRGTGRPTAQPQSYRYAHTHGARVVGAALSRAVFSIPSFQRTHFAMYQQNRQALRAWIPNGASCSAKVGSRLT